MIERGLVARSLLVCLREGADVVAFMREARRLDGVDGCVPIGLMGGIHCMCDQRGVSRLIRHPDVDLVEEEVYLRLPGNWSRDRQARAQAVVPEGVRLIRAPEAWPISQGDGVDVAIIDSGVDFRHPDLAPNIGAGVNFVRPGAAPTDETGHGTMVAGIACASQVNGYKGGVAPRARIHPVKVTREDDTATLSDVLLALEWVVDRDIPIANMSFGTDTYSLAFERAVTRAIDRGLTIVAAAGNEGRQRVAYPAAFPGVIAVAAIDQESRVARFSSTGPEVDLAAPGVRVLSTAAGGGYARASGTSFAAPFVTGVAALYVDLNPQASPAEVRRALRNSAVPLRGSSGVGAGRVDALNAVNY
jgi:subtilisin